MNLKVPPTSTTPTIKQPAVKTNPQPTIKQQNKDTFEKQKTNETKTQIHIKRRNHPI